MPPVRLLFLTHHSHTDVGYTDPQDTVFRLQAEYIDQALDYCDQTDDYPPDARFHWTCEGTGMVEHFLATRPAGQVERFLRRAREGRVEVTALPYNMTPLPGHELLARLLYPVARLRSLGIPIRHAMSCDVNGLSWGLADLLPQLGVHTLSMAINEARGRAPRPRPGAFRWRARSGRSVLVWNGELYERFRFFGIPPGAGDPVGGLRDYCRRLEAAGYPYDFAYLHVTNVPRLDNGPPHRPLADFVRDWNAAHAGELRLRLATPTAFFDHLARAAGPDLPAHQADWTDWWADGVASSACETGLVREAEWIALSAERLWAWAWLTDPASPCPASEFDERYRDAILYEEHTWGAWDSVSDPRSRLQHVLWDRKARYARNALKGFRDLRARGLERLARVVRSDGPGVLVFNPLPWSRSGVVQIPRLGGSAWVDDVPPVGYVTLGAGECQRRGALARLRERCRALFVRPPKAEGPPPPGTVRAAGNVIENDFTRLSLDSVTGGVASWYDKRLGREMVDVASPWRLHQYVYEWLDHPAGRDLVYKPGPETPDDFGTWGTGAPFRYAGATRARVRASATPFSATLTSEFAAPGARKVRQSVTLYAAAPWVDLATTIDKRDIRTPEGVYLAFPFAVPSPVFHVETAGGYFEPERQQLAGACRDWLSALSWVDVSNGEFGVTLACREAPLVQLGGVTNGRWADRLDLSRATVMAWPMTNLWFTNFRPSQGGTATFRYRLAAHAGPFDPVAATRLGWELAADLAAVDVGRRRDGALPTGRASLCEVAPDRVTLIGLKRAEAGDGMIVRLLSLCETAAPFAVRFPGRPVKAAWRATPLEEKGEPLPCDGEAVRGRAEGFGICTVYAALWDLWDLWDLWEPPIHGAATAAPNTFQVVSSGSRSMSGKAPRRRGRNPAHVKNRSNSRGKK